MAHSAPGKHYRKGLTLPQVMRTFHDDAAAERWFAKVRWPDGPRCPRCGTADVCAGTAHKSCPIAAAPAAATSLSASAPSWRTRSSDTRPGHSHLPPHHRPQRPVLHEAPPRPRDHAEVGLASGPPDSGDLARGTGALRGTCRSRRGLHRREEKEHEPGQEEGDGRPRTRRKDDRNSLARLRRGASSSRRVPIGRYSGNCERGESPLSHVEEFPRSRGQRTRVPRTSSLPLFSRARPSAGPRNEVRCHCFTRSAKRRPRNDVPHPRKPRGPLGALASSPGGGL